MLKEYLKENSISVYNLAKKIDVPYSTLNDLSNGKVNIDNCRVGFIQKLASQLELSMDQLYKICNSQKEIIVEKYNLPATVSVKNKGYYASFQYKDRIVEIPVCEVNEDSTPFIENFAAWDVENYIDEKELEEINEVLINAKR